MFCVNLSPSRPLRAVLCRGNRRFLFSTLRELSGEQGPRSHSPGFGVRSSGHRCQLVSLHQKQIGRANAASKQFARVIHGIQAVKQKTGSIANAEGATLEGKPYECIHATVEGDGTVGLVTQDRPKLLNSLSHALMGEVVDALQMFDALPQVGAPFH